MLRHPRVWMGFLSFPTTGQAQAAWTVNMAPGATEVSRSVFDLHMTIFWICVVIGVLVFGAMFWSMIVHRRSTGQQPAHFHESTTVEVLWTVVPFVILVVMAVPATRTLIHIYDTSEPELGVQITGYQWKWRYKYLGQDVEYFSNLATSQEQIHNRQAKDEHYLLEVDEPLVLVLIIFTWTPPHFWALCIHRKDEYAKANIPMLPVTHGERYTKLHILLYTLALFAVSLMPFVIRMSGLIYLLCALALGARFLDWAWALYCDSRPRAALKTFKYSIVYLFLLFMALLVDHYLPLTLLL